MSLFRNKNIKYNKKLKNEKNSEYIDIIDNKHNIIMETFKNNEDDLPKLKLLLEQYIKEYNNLADADENKIKILVDELYIKKMKVEKILKELNNSNKIDNIIKNKKPNIKYVYLETPNLIEKEKEEYIDKYTKKLEKFDNLINSYTDIYLRQCHIHNLKRKMDEIDEKIYNIENKVDELEYLDNVMGLLTDYYEDEPVKETTIEIDLMSLFNKKHIKKTDNKKNIIVDKYLMSINEPKRKKKQNMGKICENCNISKLLNIQESIFTCEQCGESESVIMDPDKPSYKDPINENKQNQYRRANHCSELLNQSQGKESTEIENSLLLEIVKELHITGITDLTKITKTDIKKVLKNINKANKAEHAIYIINKLNGIPINTLRHELIEIVKTMFGKVEEAWYILKEPSRKNFMNTNFVFHKIFELLGEDEEAEKWPYLSDGKLREYDDLWFKICEYLQWEYISSI